MSSSLHPPEDRAQRLLFVSAVGGADDARDRVVAWIGHYDTHICHNMMGVFDQNNYMYLAKITLGNPHPPNPHLLRVRLIPSEQQSFAEP